MHPQVVNRSQTIIWLILLASIVGLVFMPLLPWVSYSNGRTDYSGDMDIHFGAEAGVKEAKTLDFDLFVIGLSFVLSIIFSIIGLIGIYLVRTGGRYSLMTGHILLLTGIAFIIFGILAVVYNGLFFKDAADLANAIGIGHSMYFYNYIPLVMTIILLIGAIMYMVIVVPNAVRSLLPSRPMYPPTQQPYQQPQPPYQQP